MSVIIIVATGNKENPGRVPDENTFGNVVAEHQGGQSPCARMDASMNLYQAQNLSVLRISLISGGWGVRRNFNQLGLHVGDEVSVVRKAPFGGPLVVESRGHRVAMSRRLAEKVGVEVLP